MLVGTIGASLCFVIMLILFVMFVAEGILYILLDVFRMFWQITKESVKYIIITFNHVRAEYKRYTSL